MLRSKIMKSYPSPPYNAARVARIAGTAARIAYDGYQAYNNRGSPEGTGNVGVTTQHDAQVIYRKKRMPTKKRQQWVDFTRKVEAVTTKGVGTKTMLMNAEDTLTSPATEQIFASYTLYGSNGSDGPGYRGCNDMVQVAQNVTNSRKLIYKSGILDLTMTNVTPYPIEVDVYHVTYGNEHYSNSPNATFANASSTSITPVTTGTTQVTQNTRGAALFDFPVALSMARISILKKTKIFLGSANCSTYQIRDPRNHHIGKYDIANEITGNNFVKPRVTQGVIIIAKHVAGYTANIPTLVVGCTRKYSYATIQDNQAETGLD